MARLSEFKEAIIYGIFAMDAVPRGSRAYAVRKRSFADVTAKDAAEEEFNTYLLCLYVANTNKLMAITRHILYNIYEQFIMSKRGRTWKMEEGFYIF